MSRGQGRLSAFFKAVDFLFKDYPQTKAQASIPTSSLTGGSLMKRAEKAGINNLPFADDSSVNGLAVKSVPLLFEGIPKADSGMVSYFLKLFHKCRKGLGKLL